MTAFRKGFSTANVEISELDKRRWVGLPCLGLGCVGYGAIITHMFSMLHPSINRFLVHKMSI